MKIAVCMKSVPDTEAKIKINPETNWMDETDIKFIINPYDEYAIEEALRIKESYDDCEVTLVLLGPDRAVEELKRGLAMGADSAVHLKCDEILSPLNTAKALSNYLKNKFDLIFFGKQAIDDDNAAVGQMTSELLGIPCISAITKLEVKDGKISAKREVQKGSEIVEAPFPVAVTAEKGLNEPRYPSLKGMMMAKRKTIEEIDPAIVENGIEIKKIEYPPERGEGKIVGEGKEAVPELIRLLKEEAKIL